MTQMSVFSEDKACINPVETWVCMILFNVSSSSAVKTPSAKSVTRYYRVAEVRRRAVRITALDLDIATMSGEVTILHFGFVLTAHSTTRKLFWFWSERLVITGPTLLPDVLIDLVKLFKTVKILLVCLQKTNIFRFDVEGVFKEGHGWILVRETQNKSGVRSQVAIIVETDTLCDAMC